MVLLCGGRKTPVAPGKSGELNPGIEVCVEPMGSWFREARAKVSPAGKVRRLNDWAAVFPHAALWAGSSERVSMATLCQIREDGSMAGQWELGGQPLLVGRDDAADAHVEDETASRRHAVILHEGDICIIEDLGSQNGTWVDGRRLLTARLYHNARIVVGRTQFVFLDHPPTNLTAAQRPPQLTGSEVPVPSTVQPSLAPSRGRPGLAKQP